MMNEIHNKFWEQDLSWVLQHLIWKAKEIDYNDISHYDKEDNLAKEYAHRINLWMNWGYGDIYSFDEFLEYVRTGSFIDYDGTGYFINNDTGEKLKTISCNIDWLNKHRPENSDYIMWFNR